jgi:anti-sigma regulatory factor (Ser/Thr protein kinase)
MLHSSTFSVPAAAEAEAREDGIPGRGWGNGPGERLRDCLEHTELYFVLENDPGLIPVLVGRLQEAADQLGLFDERTADRVALVLQEALLNGIHHGNLELSSKLRNGDETTYERLAERRRQRPRYRDRRVHVLARLSRREATYVIRDEGPGFDPGRLPDPTDPANLERASGRGLLLIQAYMDEVAFNETGNEITLTKRRPVPSH